MCVASLAYLIILGSRYKVIVWAYPHSFHCVEKVGPSEPESTSLSYGEC